MYLTKKQIKILNVLFSHEFQNYLSGKHIQMMLFIT